MSAAHNNRARLTDAARLTPTEHLYNTMLDGVLYCLWFCFSFVRGRDRYPPQRKQRAFLNPWSNNNRDNIITLILYNIGVGATVGL